jgi:hypothetical protein
VASFAGSPQQPDAIKPRHIDITQKDVVILLPEHRPRGFAVFGTIDIVPLTGHLFLDHHSQILFVVNYQ